VGHTAFGGMNLRPAKLLGGDIFTGDLLDHFGSRQEHIRRLPNHHDKISDGRRIDGAPGAWSQNKGNLGNHARVENIFQENIGITSQGIYAFLYPCPAGIVEPDNRRSNTGGHIHNLADFLGIRFRQGSSEEGKILREDKNKSTVDGSVAGNNTIGERPVFLHIKVGAAMGDKNIKFFKTIFIQNFVQPLSGGILPLCMLLGYAFFTPACQSFFPLICQVQ